MTRSLFTAVLEPSTACDAPGFAVGGRSPWESIVTIFKVIKNIDFTPMIYPINPITFFFKSHKIFKKYFQQEKPVMKYLKMSKNKWNCYGVVNPVAVFTRKSGGKGCVKPNLVELLRDLLEF